MSDLTNKLAERFRNEGFSTVGFSSFGSEDLLSTRILGWIDTGSPKFNSVFGDPVAGIPLGRIVGIIGGESHGKSTLAYWLAGVCQKAGGIVFLADEEGAFRESWANTLGVTTTESIVPITLGFREVKGKGGKVEIEPEGLEDLFSKFELATETMKSDFPDVPAFIIWDSVASTLTRKELAGDYDDESIAQGARVISRGLRKFCRSIIGSKVSLIYINQLRTKIGGFGPATNTMPGGRALKYYSSVIAEVVRTSIRDGYITCFAKNKKNKVAHPFKEVNFKIDFDKGVLEK